MKPTNPCENLLFKSSSSAQSHVLLDGQKACSCFAETFELALIRHDLESAIQILLSDAPTFSPKTPATLNPILLTTFFYPGLAVYEE